MIINCNGNGIGIGMNSVISAIKNGKKAGEEGGATTGEQPVLAGLPSVLGRGRQTREARERLTSSRSTLHT